MKKGFTLVELLVVIIIVAILASFAIPQYLRNIERSMGGKALNAIGHLAEAEKLYFADNAGAYLSVADGALDARPGLGAYMELAEVDADPEWTYAVVAAVGPPPTFVITATRIRGPNATQIITWNELGVRNPAGTDTFVP